MSDTLTFRDYYIMFNYETRRKLFKDNCEKCEHCKLGDYSYYCKKENTSIYDVPPCKEIKVSIEDRK